MDLVGFVIAGERVHHEIDAPPQRKLMLALAARQKRIEALAIGIVCPARCEIVRGDDYRRDTVARPRRSRGAIRGSRRQGLDPGRARRVAAEKAVDEIEGFCCHMVWRNGLERWN